MQGSTGQATAAQQTRGRVCAGVDGLYVHIMAANSAARKFYEGQGFVTEAEEGANVAAARGHCLDGVSGAGRTLLLRDAHLCSRSGQARR
jgi:ribosomal protein S18 acetylase RimI-like enzyme